jgi:cytochrome c oxidase subunit 4
MSEHVVSKKVYYLIFALLMIFTVVTVEVAFIDLGPLNIVVAMAIAIFKATIVLLYFMHVKYSSRLTKLFVVAGFFTFGLMLLFTYADYLSRGWVPFAH